MSWVQPLSDSRRHGADRLHPAHGPAPPGGRAAPPKRIATLCRNHSRPFPLSLLPAMPRTGLRWEEDEAGIKGKAASPSGNGTPVSRKTGGDIYRLTTKEERGESAAPHGDPRAASGTPPPLPGAAAAPSAGTQEREPFLR